MAKQRSVLDRSQFHRLCKWLEAQKQPIESTMVDLCQKASSELKLSVGYSSMQDAKKITNVVVKPPRTSPDPSNRKNRMGVLAGIVLRFVEAVENDSTETYLTEEDRKALINLKNNNSLE